MPPALAAAALSAPGAENYHPATRKRLLDMITGQGSAGQGGALPGGAGHEIGEAAEDVAFRIQEIPADAEDRVERTVSIVHAAFPDAATDPEQAEAAKQAFAEGHLPARAG